MEILHIWISILFLGIMLKWGDWKRWREYYPTVLYMCMGDLIYNFLTKDEKLWRWESPVFTHTFLDILWIFTIFPAIVIVFCLINLKIKAEIDSYR